MRKMTDGRTRFLPSVLISLLLTACVLSSSVYAWFRFDRIARTDDMEVDIPPIIYIKDDNLEEMTSFNLDGLQINQPYTALFCVSPSMESVVDSFDLSVIYTENIGMVIDIYPVDVVSSAPGDGETVHRVLYDDILNRNADCYFNYTPSMKNILPSENIAEKVTYGGWEQTDPSFEAERLNRGVYKQYTGFKYSDTSESETDIYGKLNNTVSYRFFVLCVTWKQEISEAELEKEVDVVYIVSKGKAHEN